MNPADRVAAADQVVQARGRRPARPPRYHPLRELILSRAREFFREPEAIFWVYIFPMLLAVALGIAFRSKPIQEVHVVVTWVGSTPSPWVAETAERLRRDPLLKVEVKPYEEAQKDSIRGRADIVVRAGDGDLRYIYDETRPESTLGKALVDRALRWEERQGAPPAGDEPITSPGTRYIDFLIPGLIGMNIMGGGLWGVGFVIVEMRVRKLLKRFLATPMRRGDFLLSIIGSRMIFLIPEIACLLLVGTLLFGVPVRGSVAAVGAIVLVSALCFSGMGLLVASRANKIETISGLLNVVMMPMWILSGIFFSTDRFPAVFQPIIHALPLTASIDSLRSVMLEGDGLAPQAGRMAILAAWGGVSFLLSLRWFRWL